MLSSLVGALVVMASAVGLISLAIRREHVIVLRVSRRATFLLEHVRDGRYEVIDSSQVPFAAARFAAQAVARAAAEWWRIPARVARYVPSVLEVKA